MNARIIRKMLITSGLFVLILVTSGQALASTDEASIIRSDSFTLASTAAANEPVAVVATGALNVRSGPGLLYSTFAVLYQGQSVPVLGRHASNGWIKIRLFSGQEGWVNANFTVISVPLSSLAVLAGPPTTPPTPAPPVITYDAVVNSGAVNLRSGPGSGYTVITIAYQSQPLQLLGRNESGSWVKARTTSGSEGWANVSLLRLNISVWALPVVSATAPAAGAIVATGALNVRSGPSPVYNTVAVAGSGQQLTLVARNAAASWVQVRLANGVVGWVNAFYLLTNYPIQNLPIAGNIQPPANSAAVAVSALNVRYGPGSNYGAFAVVYFGQTLGLIGRNANGTWVQVRLASAAVGWVNANYISGNVQLQSLPITG